MPLGVLTFTVALPLASTVWVISVVRGAWLCIAFWNLSTTVSGRIDCCSMVVCSAVRGGSWALGMLKFSAEAVLRGSLLRSGLRSEWGDASGELGLPALVCVVAGSPVGVAIEAASAGCLPGAVWGIRAEILLEI